jgi:hypothetical protein
MQKGGGSTTVTRPKKAAISAAKPFKRPRAEESECDDSTGETAGISGKEKSGSQGGVETHVSRSSNTDSFSAFIISTSGASIRKVSLISRFIKTSSDKTTQIYGRRHGAR